MKTEIGLLMKYEVFLKVDHMILSKFCSS